MAYAALEPFGEARADIRMGSWLSLYYNAHREKGKPATSWFDFFPNVEMPQPEEAPDPDDDPEGVAEFLFAKLTAASRKA